MTKRTFIFLYSTLIVIEAILTYLLVRQYLFHDTITKIL